MLLQPPLSLLHSQAVCYSFSNIFPWNKGAGHLSDTSGFNRFHPILQAWFEHKFGVPSPVQAEAWDKITQGGHTLIASPTGSGKTLAALLPCMDRIMQDKHNDGGITGVRALYITPLKALNNDIQDHLIEYFRELDELAAGQGAPVPVIRTAVRTGDTTPSMRAAMLRNPPDLLITTPESLYILLTSEKGRGMLKNVQQIIVDEIHDLIGDRRGTHLSLTLERLSAWCSSPIQRIGVSATQKPLAVAARYLGGWEGEAPRPVNIVESRSDKKIQLRVEKLSASKITSDKEEIWTPVVERITEIIRGCSTVLVFVNNRRLSERLVLRLNDHAGYEMARSHHGSLSRERRLEAEQLLRSGKLQCLVATSSLELGIDVGSIDRVIQIDSPKEAAAGIQRVGRSGHQLGGVSSGIMLVRNRAELPEMAVLARHITDRDIEDIRVQRNCLDVLSQQVVAMVACEDWPVDDLCSFIRRSDCFRNYPPERLEQMLKVLSGFYPFVRPLIDWNRETGMLKRRKNSAVAALMGGGAIPRSSNYPVHHAASRVYLGELDEEYIFESRTGDVFQLGASSWKIQSITNHAVYVTESNNVFSEIPFWKGEALGRSFELGLAIGQFLRELSDRIAAEEQEAVSWLEKSYYLDGAASQELVSFVKQQRHTSIVPSDKIIFMEQFTDELKHTRLIIHSVFGRRLNRTWMLALQHMLKNKTGVKPAAFCGDNAVEFIYSPKEWDPSYMEMIRRFQAESLESVLLEVIPSTAQFAQTFKRMAEMSLLLNRGFKRTPAALQRLRSEELLKASLPYAEHFPLIYEATRECLQDQLDLEHLRQIVRGLQSGQIQWAVHRSSIPSPFARAVMTDFIGSQMYEDGTLGKALQYKLASLRKETASEWFGEDAALQMLDPEIIASEQARLQKGNEHENNAESLIRLLKLQGDLRAEELVGRFGASAEAWISELHTEKRIDPVSIAGDERWICSDEREVYAAFPSNAQSVHFILSRFMESVFTFSEQDLMQRYGLSAEQARQYIEQAAEQELIDRAPLKDQNNDWMSKRIINRVISLSMQRIKQEAGTVAPGVFLREMLERHHLPAAVKRSGSDGVKQVIEQLQGLFLPVSYWESVVLPSRVRGFRKEDLDMLCAQGEVIWIGANPREGKEGRVAFFLAEAKELYAPYLRRETVSKHPELLQLLRGRGASFLTALSRDMNLLPSELLEQLFELVWEGHISNDQFAPVRNYAARKNGKNHSGFGRWYALDSIHDPGIDPYSPAVLVSWLQHTLKRDGLICKATAGETSPYSWDTMYGALRQLEDWGMVLRGLFVQGIETLQFAPKESIEQWSSSAASVIIKDELGQSNHPILLPAEDPANPYGVFLKWPKVQGAAFSRKPGNYLVIVDGHWLMWVEGNGKRWFNLNEGRWELQADNQERLPVLFKRLISEMLALRKLKKIVIDRWNGEPVLDSAVSGILCGLGAENDRSSLIIWPSSIKVSTQVGSSR